MKRRTFLRNFITSSSLLMTIPTISSAQNFINPDIDALKAPKTDRDLELTISNLNRPNWLYENSFLFKCLFVPPQIIVTKGYEIKEIYTDSTIAMVEVQFDAIAILNNHKLYTIPKSKRTYYYIFQRQNNSFKLKSFTKKNIVDVSVCIQLYDKLYSNTNDMAFYNVLLELEELRR